MLFGEAQTLEEVVDKVEAVWCFGFGDGVWRCGCGWFGAGDEGMDGDAEGLGDFVDVVGWRDGGVLVVAVGGMGNIYFFCKCYATSKLL